MSHGYEASDMKDQMEDGVATGMANQFEEEQSEDDNEIELELTVEYMANGHSDMESRDYAAAEENFRSALELAEEHDFSKKLDYGPGDIILILADCLLRQDKEEAALELLKPIADGSVSDTNHSDVQSVRSGNVVDGGRDQITQLKACHTMAVIFLKRADTQAAEKRAQQAFKGRRKARGPNDSATIESVQLLIDIYTTNNDKTKARAYRRFLEPSVNIRPSIGSDISARGSIVSSLQAPALQPVVATNMSSSFPSTPGITDAATIPSIAPTLLETNQTTRSPPQVSTTTFNLPRGSLSLTAPLAGIAEVENISMEQNLPTADIERSTSQISDSIRAAVQTASTTSTLPVSPAILATRPASSGYSPALSPAHAPKPTIISQTDSTHTSELPAVSVPEPVVRDSPYTSSAYPAPLGISARKPVDGVPHPAPLSFKDQDSVPNFPRPVSTVMPRYPLTEIERTAAGPTQEHDTMSSTPAQVSQPATNVVPPTSSTTPVQPPPSDIQSAASFSSPATGSLYASSSVRTSSSVASVPSSTLAKNSVLPPVDSKPSQIGVQSLVTTAAPVLPPVNIPHHMPETQSATTVPRDIVSPVEMLGSTSNDPLPAPTARLAIYSMYASRSTPSPPAAALSASQAALASIFAESGGKPSRKSSPLGSKGSSTTLSSKNVAAATTSAPPARQPSPAEKTLSPPPLMSPAPTSQATTETTPTDGTSRQEEVPAVSRTFSWLTEAKLSVPSSITRVVSSQANAPEAAPARFDTSSTSHAPAVTTKKRNWSVPFVRSKTDSSTKKTADLPPPIPGSAASVYISSRNPSLTTVGSTVESKRHMSLVSNTGSQSLSFLDKEFTFGGEKPPRSSISRSVTSASIAPSRTRQELAPRFANIKAMRAEGKKSASIDAAMKLLREYDPEKKTLVIREGELKKNMKESHKGLASTGHGYAPIHLFCDRRTEAAVEVELLIEQGVDVNAVACKAGMPGHDPFTPLQRAIEHGHAEIVRLLVEADVAIAPPKPQKGAPNLSAEIVNHPLLLACTKGHTEITYILLRASAARMVKEFPQRQWHGNSLLHEACWQADTVMVKMLLDHLKTIKSQHHSSSGPDFESGIIGSPGQQDQFGATPIMYAIDLRDCTSQRMRTQKSARRKDCLRLLLEHGIHGDLHSQQYRDNIAHVLSTKWTRGPGKGHSIFCYCDEAGEEELTRLLDPFRYQVTPSMRCHATPQCTALIGSSIRSGSVRSGNTDRQGKMPDFPELMSEPIVWADSPTTGAHFELPGGDGGAGRASVVGRGAVSVVSGEMPGSPVTRMSRGGGNGFVAGFSELASETSQGQSQRS